MPTAARPAGALVRARLWVPALLVCLVVPALGLLPAPPAEGATASVSGATEESGEPGTEEAADPLTPAEYARQAFRATNHVRADHEKKRTRANACLRRFALRQAKALADRDVDHLDASDHQDLGPVLETCGLRLAGENLALGFESGRKAVRKGWMKSDSHRANVLERRYRLMALASRRTDSGRWVAVQLFGRRA